MKALPSEIEELGTTSPGRAGLEAVRKPSVTEWWAQGCVLIPTHRVVISAKSEPRPRVAPDSVG